MAGGTAEAPSWLTNPPAGQQPVGGGDSWPAMQENYGGVSIGQPAAGSLGNKPAGGSWPAQQGYGGVSVAPCQTQPLALDN